MRTYILRRLLAAIPLLFISTFLLFLLMQATGSYFDKYRDAQIDKKLIEKARREAGYYDPLLIQYFKWLRGLFFDIKLWQDDGVLADFEDFDVVRAYAIDGPASFRERDRGREGYFGEIHFKQGGTFARFNRFDNPAAFLRPVPDYNLKNPDPTPWQAWWSQEQANLDAWNQWWKTARQPEQPENIREAIESALQGLTNPETTRRIQAWDFLREINLRNGAFWDERLFSDFRCVLENLDSESLSVTLRFLSHERPPVEQRIDLSAAEKKDIRLALADLRNQGVNLPAVTGIEFVGSSEGKILLDNLRLIQSGLRLSLASTPNFGISLEHQKPVFELLWPRIQNTVLLSVLSLLFTWLIALPVGIYCAVHQYSWSDRFFAFLTFMGMSMPSFFLTILLLFGVYHLNMATEAIVLPTDGLTSPWHEELSLPGRVGDILWHLVIPVIALGVGGMAGLQRVMRGNLLEVLRTQYVLTARAKGLPERKVIYRHAVRTAINPLITMLGTSLPILLSGSVLVEVLCSFPGMGQLMFQSVMDRDVPVVMAVNICGAVLLILGNLLADILNAMVDPRIRIGEGKAA